ncbi:MAG: transmembrane protein, distant homology with ydbS, partial [uncultured Nocardioidaceae bacterium]
ARTLRTAGHRVAAGLTATGGAASRHPGSGRGACPGHARSPLVAPRGPWLAGRTRRCRGAHGGRRRVARPGPQCPVLGVLREGRGPLHQARGDVSRAGGRPLRTHAVRRRAHRSAGAGLRRRQRAPAHSQPRDQRPDPRTSPGGGSPAQGQADLARRSTGSGLV